MFISFIIYHRLKTCQAKKKKNEISLSVKALSTDGSIVDGNAAGTSHIAWIKLNLCLFQFAARFPEKSFPNFKKTVEVCF